MSFSRYACLLGLSLLSPVGAAAGEDAAQFEASPEPVPADSRRSVRLGTTAIRGNNELPRVLYILPWQMPEAVELAGRPATSLVEEVLSPLDREVLGREVGYFEQLKADAADASTAADDEEVD